MKKKKSLNGLGRTMVIKGPKEVITTALSELNWDIYIHEEVPSADNNVLIRMELGEPDINTKNLALSKYNQLKFIILAITESEYTDYIIFKDYGNEDLLICSAYTSNYGSIAAEELEGVMFFPDQEFSCTYEDYSCGEEATLEYTFPVKEQWKDDSKFSNT